jgi:hypothetical protein
MSGDVGSALDQKLQVKMIAYRVAVAAGRVGLPISTALPSRWSHR